MRIKRVLLQTLPSVFLIIFSCSNSSKGLKLMTYNIRLDNQEDGINRWDERKKGLVSLIKKSNPDLIQSWMYHADFITIFLKVFFIV